MTLPTTWRYGVIVAAEAIAVGKCEVGENAGTIPQWCQTLTGNKPPDYWCASSGARSFERALRHRSPVLLSASCEQHRQRALAKGALRTRAEFDAARAADPLSVAGWIGLCIGPDAAGNPHAHHFVIVGNLNTQAELVTRGPRGGFLTVEGNAANPANAGSRNGDGQYAGRERGHPDDRTTYAFIDPEALC